MSTTRRVLGIDGTYGGIHLLEETSSVYADQFLGNVQRDVCVCDFHVADISQTSAPSIGGFRLDRVLCIDHHARDPRFYRIVSSANLALAQREADGRAFDGPVFINHTDCDSILSAGLMAGLLEPRAIYGDAAIAADHTGEEHPVADLLQALDDERDMVLSFESLAALETGQPLPARAAAALDIRTREREYARMLVEAGRFEMADGVALGEPTESIAGEMLVSLLRSAMVIAVASQMPGGARWQVRIRRGLAAPAAFTLYDLDLASFDQAFGCRWNAGSNTRGGGTSMPPAEYAQRLRRELRAALARLSTRGCGSNTARSPR